jgi:hemerythrin superfamily protein
VQTPIELMLDEAQDIYTALSHLIDQFHTMNLDTRLKQSTELFDTIRLFFARHKMIGGEAALSDPEYTAFEDAHQKTLDIYERMIMLHVEEEDYFDRLQQLKDAFTIYASEHYKLFLEHRQAQLSPEAQNSMAKDLQALQVSQ